jgi:hypothetical protein
MEKQNFEKELSEMKKPVMPVLKHEAILSDAIINAKDKSVVSLWWLSVPLFIIMMLLMKSFYMPGSTLLSGLHELAAGNKYLSFVFFLISPIILILVNTLTIRKIYFLSGSPRSFHFLWIVWLNIVIIGLSAVILIIYSL